MDDPDAPPVRVRKIDWRAVIRHLDALPEGTTVYVGIVDQSVRTHLKHGRYQYLDPSRYDIWTEKDGESRTRARLYMRRKT